ncbi:MAG: sugar O-acetyltransferase [Armatimonadota bacterium]
MNEKTEREKMLSGELYNANDPELTSARRRARSLYRRFNVTDGEGERLAILLDLLGRMGAGVSINPPFYVDYGSNIYLGGHVYMNLGCTILDCAEVRIGDNVMIGPNVQIYAATHPVEAVSRIAGPELARPVAIEENVWIGGGAIICPGVTIGRNTTIGAGTVVTKNVPPNVVAAGNPARVIRTLGVIA